MRMESAGLVARRPHPTDARLVRIHLTDRGRALEKVLDEEMQRLSERALATLSPRSGRSSSAPGRAPPQRRLTDRAAGGLPRGSALPGGAARVVARTGLSRSRAYALPREERARSPHANGQPPAHQPTASR
jgi:hypothetical protein